MLRIKAYTAVAFHFYMEAKFGPLEKGVKRLTSTETKFFRITSGYSLFYHQRNVRGLEL